MRNKYKVKGIGSEQVVESKIKIYTSQDGTRITKVEDRWDDKLPDGGFKTVSLRSFFSLFRFFLPFSFGGWYEGEVKLNLFLLTWVILVLGHEELEQCRRAEVGFCSQVS